mgnify:CR=1 FL=1
MKKNDTAIDELLTRGVEEVIVREHLEKRIRAGDKLRVKLGIDPTGPHLHIGHAVLLRKLKQFQELGHMIVLIIGDFTAQIGDPSGKSVTRKRLSEKDVRANFASYFAQIGKILDVKKIEVRYNNEWFMKGGAALLTELTSFVTIQRVLERDDFQKRLKSDDDISVLEILYPLLQGYDSVAIKADVEIGGNDQKFNMLMGRRIQRRYEQPEQDVITMKLLVDPTGKKMGKTEGNMITLEDTAEDMYGKVMAWGDGMIVGGFELCTDVPMEEVHAIAQQLRREEVNPRDVKMRLAWEIVTLYHGAAAAKKAEAAFAQTFQRKEMPEDIRECRMQNAELGIIDLLLQTKLTVSKSEARRVIEQKGVKVDGKVVDDAQAMIQLSKKGVLIQKGKRYFVRVMSSA